MMPREMGARRSGPYLTLLACALALLFQASEASARNRYAFFPPRPERLRAVRYAELDAKHCLRMLELREIPFTPATPAQKKKAKTIEAPVVLTGALQGVELQHAYAGFRDQPRVMDCRLLLALDDLATIAGDRGVAVIRYNSIYRRGWTKKGHRHPAGVAIDVVSFLMQDGRELRILDDFGGNGIGSKTCGEDSARPAAGKPTELRRLVCAIHEAHSFNLVLTPHYDRRHKDHLHLEVRRGIRWFLTQ